ncbi:MAG: putative metal-binding motif-containing protein [Sandaracinaceae bacterium]
MTARALLALSLLILAAACGAPPCPDGSLRDPSGRCLADAAVSDADGSTDGAIPGSIDAGVPVPDGCVPSDETCNGEDDDCDGALDEGFAPTTYYADADEDGYGSDEASVERCEAPSGYVDRAGDCDDADPMVHPMIDEACNGVDDDCDAMVDEPFECSVGMEVACVTSCGTMGSSTCDAMCGIPTACEPPDETCNGLDDDCDGQRDEAFACARGGAVACTTSCGSTGAGVCSDACELPDAAACTPPVETCNGVDDDCDTIPDDGFACAAGFTVPCSTTCGTAGTRVCTSSCTLPTSCTAPAETCNLMDDDCDSRVDEGTTTTGAPHDIGVAMARVSVVETTSGAVVIESRSGELWARRLDARGLTTGTDVRITHGALSFGAVSYAAGASRNIVVAWSTGGMLRATVLTESLGTVTAERTIETLPSGAGRIGLAMRGSSAYFAYHSGTTIRAMSASIPGLLVTGSSYVEATSAREDFDVTSGTSATFLAYVSTSDDVYVKAIPSAGLATTQQVTSGATVEAAVAIGGPFLAVAYQAGATVRFASLAYTPPSGLTPGALSVASNISIESTGAASFTRPMALTYAQGVWHVSALLSSGRWYRYEVLPGTSVSLRSSVDLGSGFTGTAVSSIGGGFGHVELVGTRPSPSGIGYFVGCP